MPNTVISAENLSKKYVISHQGAGGGGLRHTIEDGIRAPFRWGRKLVASPGGAQAAAGGAAPSSREDFWALRDVSFEVGSGEVLGIIGRNGAGKSTLLKILSRITEPTGGSVQIDGRVASLLEVGTGFHPELTGRENVFLNGAILGMGRVEIRRKFDEIVAFAEVEKFIDTPVKRYSSGMYVRLAFAVAAHLEPEILIIDEVLAVGDSQFQRKCISRMQDAAKGGRTVLFVSHNIQAVSTLTTRCIHMKEGRAEFLGPTSEAIARYLADGVQPEFGFACEPDGGRPQIVGVRLETTYPSNVQVSGEAMTLHFDVYTPAPVANGSFSFAITDNVGGRIVHCWIFDSQQPLFRSAGRHRLRCRIPKLRLYMGRYSIAAYLAEGEGGQHFQTLDKVCPFEVAMYGKDRDWKWQENACVYVEDFTWDSEQS